MVLNLDIAPTFADAAGVSTPSDVEGRSMLPLLTKPNAPWRDHFLIEHGPGGVPAYCAIRTTDWKYVLYATGEEELFHLTGSAAAGDGPYELVNQAANPKPLYRDELDRLRGIEQQMCRPQPPGGLPSP
jgi:N-acetylglucosamine-6-sulfatase